MAQIKIVDQNSNINVWSVLDENDYTYEVECQGYVSYVYKENCYMKNGEMYSTETRNITYEELGSEHICENCIYCDICTDKVKKCEYWDNGDVLGV